MTSVAWWDKAPQDSDSSGPSLQQGVASSSRDFIATRVSRRSWADPQGLQCESIVEEDDNSSTGSHGHNIGDASDDEIESTILGHRTMAQLFNAQFIHSSEAMALPFEPDPDSSSTADTGSKCGSVGTSADSRWTGPSTPTSPSMILAERKSGEKRRSLRGASPSPCGPPPNEPLPDLPPDAVVRRSWHESSRLEKRTPSLLGAPSPALSHESAFPRFHYAASASTRSSDSLEDETIDSLHRACSGDRAGSPEARSDTQWHSDSSLAEEPAWTSHLKGKQSIAASRALQYLLADAEPRSLSQEPRSSNYASRENGTGLLDGDSSQEAAESSNGSFTLEATRARIPQGVSRAHQSPVRNQATNFSRPSSSLQFYSGLGLDERSASQETLNQEDFKQATPVRPILSEAERLVGREPSDQPTDSDSGTDGAQTNAPRKKRRQRRQRDSLASFDNQRATAPSSRKQTLPKSGKLESEEVSSPQGAASDPYAFYAFSPELPPFVPQGLRPKDLTGAGTWNSLAARASAASTLEESSQPSLSRVSSFASSIWSEKDIDPNGPVSIKAVAARTRARQIEAAEFLQRQANLLARHKWQPTDIQAAVENHLNQQNGSGSFSQRDSSSMALETISEFSGAPGVAYNFPAYFTHTSSSGSPLSRTQSFGSTSDLRSMRSEASVGVGSDAPLPKQYREFSQQTTPPSSPELSEYKHRSSEASVGPDEDIVQMPNQSGVGTDIRKSRRRAQMTLAMRADDIFSESSADEDEGLRAATPTQSPQRRSLRRGGRKAITDPGWPQKIQNARLSSRKSNVGTVLLTPSPRRAPSVQSGHSSDSTVNGRAVTDAARPYEDSSDEDDNSGESDIDLSTPLRELATKSGAFDAVVQARGAKRKLKEPTAADGEVKLETGERPLAGGTRVKEAVAAAINDEDLSRSTIITPNEAEAAAVDHEANESTAKEGSPRGSSIGALDRKDSQRGRRSFWERSHDRFRSSSPDLEDSFAEESQTEGEDENESLMLSEIDFPEPAKRYSRAPARNEDPYLTGDDDVDWTLPRELNRTPSSLLDDRISECLARQVSIVNTQRAPRSQTVSPVGTRPHSVLSISAVTDSDGEGTDPGQNETSPEESSQPAQSMKSLMRNGAVTPTGNRSNGSAKGSPNDQVFSGIAPLVEAAAESEADGIRVDSSSTATESKIAYRVPSTPVRQSLPVATSRLASDSFLQRRARADTEPQNLAISPLRAGPKFPERSTSLAGGDRTRSPWAASPSSDQGSAKTIPSVSTNTPTPVANAIEKPETPRVSQLRPPSVRRISSSASLGKARSPSSPVDLRSQSPLQQLSSIQLSPGNFEREASSSPNKAPSTPKSIRAPSANNARSPKTGIPSPTILRRASDRGLGGMYTSTSPLAVAASKRSGLPVMTRR